MTQHKKLLGVLLCGAIFVSLQACTKNYEKINKNPYESLKEDLEPGDYLIRSAVVNLQSFVIPADEHLHQFQEVLSGCSFAGYTAVTSTWTAKFSTYNAPSDWVRAPFNDVITGVYPYYRELQGATSDPVILAIGDLLRVAAMHRITDAYGPIPYSQMLVQKGTNSAYDPQNEVYATMVAELNQVIETLTDHRHADPAAYKNFDNVYAGDVVKWVKFANSLKLRMAMRMSYANPTLARTSAEQAVAHEIGVITSNADNAAMKVAKNPFELQIAQWGDDRAGADILSFMNGYKDPRREKYFNLSTFTAAPATPGGPLVESFYGLRSGVDIANRDVAVRYSMPKVSVSDPIIWMNAAEVSFLKAEGALNGWSMGDTPGNLYNSGIALSFEQWGAAGAADYQQNSSFTPQAYIDPMGKFSYNGTTSSITIKWEDGATIEEKQERIITQKWIANFPLGNESWAEFRRTGYPRLMPVVSNKSGGTVPAGQFVSRLPFPDTEYTENGPNVRAAVVMLGGPDTQGTKLWWDKKVR